MPLAEEERADLLALLQDADACPVGRPVAVHQLAHPGRSHPRRQLRRTVHGGHGRDLSSRGSPHRQGQRHRPGPLQGPRSGRHHRACRPQPAPERTTVRLQGRDRLDRRHHPPSRHQASSRPGADHPCTSTRPRAHLLLGSPHAALEGQHEGSETRGHRRRLDRRRRTSGHRLRRGTPDGRRWSRPGAGRPERRRPANLAATGTPALAR